MATRGRPGPTASRGKEPDSGRRPFPGSFLFVCRVKASVWTYSWCGVAHGLPNGCVLCRPEVNIGVFPSPSLAFKISSFLFRVSALPALYLLGYHMHISCVPGVVRGKEEELDPRDGSFRARTSAIAASALNCRAISSASASVLITFWFRVFLPCWAGLELLSSR